MIVCSLASQLERRGKGQEQRRGRSLRLASLYTAWHVATLPARRLGNVSIVGSHLPDQEVGGKLGQCVLHPHSS